MVISGQLDNVCCFPIVNRIIVKKIDGLVDQQTHNSGNGLLLADLCACAAAALKPAVVLPAAAAAVCERRCGRRLLCFPPVRNASTRTEQNGTEPSRSLAQL